ncbi:MAG: prevent-host-death protein [Candidatus Marinimicrobia bacterium]|nr:prevent-host-death protein [Candidatus Neomarinimicrobiota bacterium]MBL7059585.1 prevent-host-death protein [Candidatus Neomarinimicrobiota bacterium]
MKTITAQEIKRRGISAVDEKLKIGPVHVIKNNKPKYVVMDEESYTELISEIETAYETRLNTALNEIDRGELASHDTVDDLMAAIESEQD